MVKITLADYRKIHPDFRAIIDGKRCAFAGSIGIKEGYCRLAMEGHDFEITPTPRTNKNASRAK